MSSAIFFQANISRVSELFHFFILVLDLYNKVIAGILGFTTHGDSTEYWLLQVFPGHHQNSTAGENLKSHPSNDTYAQFDYIRSDLFVQQLITLKEYKNALVAKSENYGGRKAKS